MHNGIGLQTPRGSGTNGYVQRNMSFVMKSREKVNYKTEEDIKKLDALANKKPNQGILAHERKRLIELKCLEMQELMEDQGYPDDEIESKVALFRKMLMDKEKLGEKEVPKDDFGRPVVKESHQIAEANQEKNSKMREALGISQYFVEGSSLDPERKSKEAAAAAAEEAKKKYTLIADSISSSPEGSQGKEKDKKRKKKSHSRHEKMETSPKKKKSGKKLKRERSISPEVQKKKKSKKPVKEKTRLKSKTDSSHKKCERSSSSSSSSSSESDADESSSSSSSRDSNSESDSSQNKHKNSSKHEKNRKVNRKRSTSSERIRYSKDARSRKDIYEAKKAKYKRKSIRTSSSSDDSSPKQYYRLEPVLLKPKSKHKKSRQIIEIPKKNAFELKKYDKKKRGWESSSDDDNEVSRPESKRHKRSGSLSSSKTSKHRSDRDEVKMQSKIDSHRSSKRSEKNYHATLHKCPQDRSRSGGDKHKSHRKGRSSEDESDDNQWKQKERSKEGEDKRNQEKEGKNKKKQHKKNTEAPKQHNGYSKHACRSLTKEAEESERSERSESIHKHEKYTPRSPSLSPVAYKNKKHIIETSPIENSSMHKKKKLPKSPTISPPKRVKSKSHRSHKASIDSHPQKRSNRHDTKSRSQSPVTKTRRNGKDYKSSTKGLSKAGHSPRNISHDSKSLTQSPRQHKNSKTQTRLRSNLRDRSVSESIHSDQSDCFKSDSENAGRNRKPKGVVSETAYKSCSNSPAYHKSSSGKSKRNRAHSEESSLDECKTSISKSRESMVILSETCQITATKDTKIDNQQNRDSSNGPMSPSPNDFKKQKTNKDTTKSMNKTTINKNSPDWSSSKVFSPKNAKSKTLSTKCSATQELKVKRGNSEETSLSSISVVIGIDQDNENTFKKKNNWSVVSIGNNASPNEDSKGTLASRSENNASPIIKESKVISNSAKKSSTKQQKDSDEKPIKGKDHSRSVSENTDQEKNSKNKERVLDGSRSCSRSTSAHSASDSERSSRSNSYSCRTKSYSKSRSVSYSKSRSRSGSKRRSKSRSQTHSKSYSRSRSRSISIYSRSRSRSYSSRSRSRSIARSPSIPRRRGSPSFLDKRRITS